MSRSKRLALAAALPLFAASALAAALEPVTLRAATELGARLAPPDLARQIVRRAPQFRGGVDAVRRLLETGVLRDDASFLRAASGEARRAIELVRRRVPFDQVVEQLGRAAAMAATAGQPLRDPPPGSVEAALAVDFQSYALSTRPRTARVVYPLSNDEADPVLRAALARARSLDQAVLREYRRVDGGRGVDRFDDRSTAFGVAALSFNHASSDVAQVLRSVWRAAGGDDRRVQIVRGLDGSVFIIGRPGGLRGSP